jgi:NAD(P)-dependent dehydrogenase (short-subunit alcohol dehydrogenase family)
MVTGGSRGIGRNTVESLAKRGVRSIFTDHSHSADAQSVVAAVKSHHNMPFEKATEEELDNIYNAMSRACCEHVAPRKTHRACTTKSNPGTEGQNESSNQHTEPRP